MKDKKKNVILLIIAVFLLLMLAASCKTKKSVAGQVLSSRSDSVSTTKSDSVSTERTVTVNDSSEVRDSVATQYIIGKYDSTAGARVDTLKQFRYHYERKTTDRDRSDSEQKQSAVATAQASSTSQTEKSSVQPEERRTASKTWPVAIAIVALVAVVLTASYYIVRWLHKRGQ